MKRKYELFPLDLRSRTQSSERYCFRFFSTCFEREYCCCCYLLFHHPPRRSSRHPYLRPHQRLIPHRGPAAHRSTGGDVRSLVGCHPKETLHCCQSLGWCLVLPVLFQRTQDVHHLLSPKLTTIFAKSRSFCVDFLTLKTLI